MQTLQEDIKPSSLEIEIKTILQDRELDEEEKIVAILELDEPSIDEAMAEKIVKGYVRGYRLAKRQAMLSA